MQKLDLEMRNALANFHTGSETKDFLKSSGLIERQFYLI